MLQCLICGKLIHTYIHTYIASAIHRDLRSGCRKLERLITFSKYSVQYHRHKDGDRGDVCSEEEVEEAPHGDAEEKMSMKQQHHVCIRHAICMYVCMYAVPS